MHVHLGLLEAIRTFGYVIIIGFFYRLFTLILQDKGYKKLASAFGFIY